jgi:large subunit ribosomal protein L9
MKVILNKDLATLGEEGDVKDVAKGYARNYLFPRGIALPYNEKTIQLFEGRKDEIEARKALKRQDAAGLKEKLEALTMTLSMPAGANGKLYGAVTVQTVADELVKQGFQIERKKIEIPGNTIKSVGRYKVSVKLYESSAAECTVIVEGQAIKTETRTSALQRGRRREPAADTVAAAAAESAPGTAAAGTGETAAETPATVSPEAALPEASASPAAETAAEAVPAADTGALAEENQAPADDAR